MPRFLFIVSRKLPRMYEHLSQQFAGEPTVKVILDRRRTDERRGEGERRLNTGADEELQVVGYAFVRLDD